MRGWGSHYTLTLTCALSSTFTPSQRPGTSSNFITAASTLTTFFFNLDSFDMSSENCPSKSSSTCNLSATLWMARIQSSLHPAQHSHHHHHRMTGLTWCRHSSASGPRYKVSVTDVVSVRRSGKTDTFSTQCGMMRRLTLMWRSLVGRSKSGRRRPETHGLPVLHDMSPGRSALTTKTTAGVDVTGRPSLVEDCQWGRPAHSHSDTCIRVHRAWTLSSQALATNETPSAAMKHDHTEKLGKSCKPLHW